jgi:hypothetical protein
MSLSADQAAVLELILQRGQTYADLAGLLGIDEDEVRARARAGLKELGGGADPDRRVGLTDYLLGQADPIDRADAVRHLRSDPGDLELARVLSARLREIVPDAELPRLPGEGPPPPDAAADDERASWSPRTRLLAALGAGALVLAVAVLAITGAFSGDDAAGGETTTTASADEELAGEEITSVPLKPEGSGDATGTASVGITDDDQAYLDLSIENLDPPAQGQVYVVWFLFDEKRGYPLSPIVPDNDGSYQDRFAIPSDALALVATSRFINVSVGGIRSVQRTIQRAVEEEELVVQRAGETVLQGKIPRARGQRGRS